MPEFCKFSISPSFARNRILTKFTCSYVSTRFPSGRCFFFLDLMHPSRWWPIFFATVIPELSKPCLWYANHGPVVYTFLPLSRPEIIIYLLGVKKLEKKEYWLLVCVCVCMCVCSSSYHIHFLRSILGDFIVMGAFPILCTRASILTRELRVTSTLSPLIFDMFHPCCLFERMKNNLFGLIEWTLHYVGTS